MRPGLRLATALAVAVVVLLGGCGSTLPPSPPETGAVPSGDRPGASASGAAAAIVDPSLLDVLPEDIDGFPRTADEETAAQIAADPTTDPAIERLDVAIYVDPGDELESDFAIVNVVAVRPGVFGTDWFRTWRETYDEAACEIAGGLSPGSAQAEIGGYETFIGTCEGGAHTYHVHIPGPDRVVAITSVGAGRFGERVVAGLRE